MEVTQISTQTCAYLKNMQILSEFGPCSVKLDGCQSSGLSLCETVTKGVKQCGQACGLQVHLKRSCSHSSLEKMELLKLMQKEESNS